MIVMLDREITKRDYDTSNNIPIDMTESDNTEYGNEWRTYRQRNYNLENHRGEAYSLILGQCTQLFQEKTNQDKAWNTISNSYRPLFLIQLIEKRYWRRENISIRFQPSKTRNLPYTHFNKAQLPIHNGMRDSTQSLMSLSTLE